MPNLSFDPNETVTVTRKYFELLRVGASKSIGRTTIESMQLKTYEVSWLDGLVLDITADLLADRLAEDRYKRQVIFKYPASWLQHLKEQKAPEWFKRKYPVKYQTVTKTVNVQFKRYATYPKANLSIDKSRSVFIDTLGGLETIRDVVHSEVV